MNWSRIKTAMAHLVALFALWGVVAFGVGFFGSAVIVGIKLAWRLAR